MRWQWLLLCFVAMPAMAGSWSNLAGGGGSGGGGGLSVDTSATSNSLLYLDRSSGAAVLKATNCSVNPADPSALVCPAQIDTYSAAANPVNGTNTCDTKETWLNTATGAYFACSDGAADTWVRVNPFQVLQSCFVLPKPAVALANTDDYPSIWRAPAGTTISQVWCDSDQTATTVQLQKDDGAPANMLTANLACDSTATTGFVSGENVLALGDRLDYLTVAVSGAPTRISVCYVMVQQ